MANRISLLLAALLLGGCDFVSVTSDVVTASAEAPEGWESLESEGAATRLYYQFVDEQRRVRFVERLDEVPEALRAGVGFVKMEAPPPLSPGDAARLRAAQRRPTGGSLIARNAATSSGIVLYSAEWCGACKKAKRYLDRNGIEYEELDIDEPRHAAALLRLTGRRAVPVINVGGRVLTGFSAQSYDALIDRA